MRKLANDIQAVINTLSGLEIKATPATIERLYGCFGVLANTRNELNRMADAQDQAMAAMKEAASNKQQEMVVEPVNDTQEVPDESAVDPE